MSLKDKISLEKSELREKFRNNKNLKISSRFWENFAEKDIKLRK